MGELKTILKEMRTYNPKADEHGGKFIIPGWADRIEKVLVIQLIPDINPVMFNNDVVFGYQKAKNEVIEVLTRAGLTVKLS